MRSARSIMVVLVLGAATGLSAPATAQSITAVSGTFSGPASARVATFNFASGASADEFYFEPAIGCDSPNPAPECDPTLVPGRYQIYRNDIVFGISWTDCPPSFGSMVTVTTGALQITCSDVPTGATTRGKRIRVRDTGGATLASRNGIFARYLFDIPARATGGNARSFINTEVFYNDGGGTGGGTSFDGTLTITMDPIAPTLSYNPPPGQIVFSGGTQGSVQNRSIDVTASGGAGAGTVSRTCVDPGTGFTVTGGNQAAIGIGGTAADIALTCALAAAPRNGTLSCTETDAPSGSSRSLSWPLSCPAADQPQYSSAPRPSAVAAAYGSILSPVASTTIQVTNTGAAPLLVSPCNFTAGAPFALSRTGFSAAMLAPSATGELIIDCTAPAPGSELATSLTCSTNDPDRDSVLYPVRCVAPPMAMVGASASPLPRLSSPAADPDAMLGAAASAAAGPNDEEIIVVGAPEGGTDGRAYVYVRSPTQLTKNAGDAYDIARDEALGDAVAMLEPPAYRVRNLFGKGIGDKFGTAVAVAPGGMTIAIGAPDALGAGSVFVYQRPAGGWGDLSTLTPVEIAAPAPGAGVSADGFGTSLQFDASGTLLVGAPLSQVNGNAGAGAAWMFQQNGGSWSPNGNPLTATTAEANAGFGAALVNQDDIVAVGAPGEASQTGAMYVYTRSGGNVGAATRMAAATGVPGDKWGTSIAIGGGVIAVGASGDDTAAGNDSGSVSILLRGTGAAATEVGTLMPDIGAGQQAGTAVATNGNVILVGAPLANSFTSSGGRAYAYRLDDTVQATELPDGFYENAIGKSGDRYGAALAIGPRRAIVGAPLSDETDGDHEGRADPFLLDGIFRGGLER